MNFPVVKSKEEVIGSGPYVVESVEKDKVVLKASHTALTNIEKINVFMYPKNDAKINSFLANETDVISASFINLLSFPLPQEALKRNMFPITLHF